ncbi:peptidase S8/S53 domain-containing protein [Syncephalis plumigaleata]|nr:peptidase S8/S53 domain-containing protein [Syncephalis plumigaleata]
MRASIVFKATLVLIGLTSIVAGQSAGRLVAPVIDEPASTVIVEMNEEPGTRAVNGEHAKVEQALAKLAIPYKLRLRYQTAMNGISIQVSNRHLDAIRNIPQVKHVWVMASAKVAGQVDNAASTASSNGNVKPYAHSMTGVDRVQRLHGLNGKGVRVGVIDTGIDYLHPALGGCFGKNCRVAYGWDFVGRNYKDVGDPLEPHPDPRDICGGHGTHIAGIIGANESGLVGVAPEVTFGAYRISGCNGVLEGDVLIGAMERALNDHMDIINISIYTGNTWEDNPRATTAERLARKGVVVVAAMGNAGRRGMWQSSAPAIAPLALSIASVDNISLVPTAFQLDIPNRPVYSYIALSGQSIFNLTNINIVSVPDNTDNSGCSLVPNRSENSIILVSQTSCTVAQKADIAHRGKAAAVIVYGGKLADMKSVHQNDDKHTPVPVIFISNEDGQDIRKLLSDTKYHQVGIRANFNPTITPTPNETGGQVSAFSSWGPSPDLDIKPDVAAPGGFIFSTYPLPMGGYTVMSGTSMSTPYVVGAVALCLQKYGRSNYTITSYRQSLQNTAQPIPDPNVPGRYTSVAKQGAGLINVERMIFGTTNVAPARIALNDTEFGMHNGKSTRNLTIYNDSTEDRLFAISHLPSMSVRGIGADGVVPNEPEQRNAPANILARYHKVYVKARSAARISIDITEPANLPANEYWVYSGFVDIRPVAGPNGKPVPDADLHRVSVPYLGVKGRMRDLRVLRISEQLPSLRPMGQPDNVAGSFNRPQTYTMQNDDCPELVFRLEMPSELLKLQLYNANTNEMLGDVPGFITEQVGRHELTDDNKQMKNTWPGIYTAIDDKGLSTTMSAIDGRYYIKIMALRIFGNPNNEKDYDIWKSPIITIKR